MNTTTTCVYVREANCIGYCFEQAYTSQIQIHRRYDNDRDRLQELKTLVADYEHAWSNIMHEEAYRDTLLMWPIEKDLREKIHVAVLLEDCYK